MSKKAALRVCFTAMSFRKRLSRRKETYRDAHGGGCCAHSFRRQISAVHTIVFLVVIGGQEGLAGVEIVLLRNEIVHSAIMFLKNNFLRSLSHER